MPEKADSDPKNGAGDYPIKLSSPEGAVHPALRSLRPARQMSVVRSTAAGGSRLLAKCCSLEYNIMSRKITTQKGILIWKRWGTCAGPAIAAR